MLNTYIEGEIPGREQIGSVTCICPHFHHHQGLTHLTGSDISSEGVSSQWTWGS